MLILVSRKVTETAETSEVNLKKVVHVLRCSTNLFNSTSDLVQMMKMSSIISNLMGEFKKSVV